MYRLMVCSLRKPSQLSTFLQHQIRFSTVPSHSTSEVKQTGVSNDYDYMRHLIIEVQKHRAEHQLRRNRLDALLLEKPQIFPQQVKEPVPQLTVDQPVENSLPVPRVETELASEPKDQYELFEQRVEELDVKSVTPVLEPSDTLAEYVPRSEVLTELVKLGVNLSLLEKIPGGANCLVRLDFERDVVPLLLFLQDLDIPSKDMARMITHCPKIFKVSIPELESRIQYFVSKRFSREAIISIIVQQPNVLSNRSVFIDKQLGALQKKFFLTGDELRHIVTLVPRLIIFSSDNIFVSVHLNTMMKKMMCFQDKELHDMVIECPKLLLISKKLLIRNFTYLHKNLGLEHDSLSLCPRSLTVSTRILKERVGYLQHKGLLQLDPTKELYTPLDSVVGMTDNNFCLHFAKISLSEFNRYLKTL